MRVQVKYTIDDKIAASAKSAAYKSGMKLSAWVERAIETKLAYERAQSLTRSGVRPVHPSGKGGAA